MVLLSYKGGLTPMAEHPSDKKLTSSTRESRRSKKPIATPAIETIRQIVDILKPYELSKTQRLRTYQAMMLDDAVGNAFAANSILIEKAFSNFTVEWNKDSEDSKEAADFLRWNLANLTGQTVRSIARSAAEFKRDGLAPFEKTFKKGTGDWSDKWVLDRLNYIHPLSLDQSVPFTITNGGRTVTEMRQSLQAFRNSTDIARNFEQFTSRGFVSIPRNKLAFMTYAATDAQPFGLSAFDTCYTAWREKILLQDYTLVGVTKDFSGTPVLYLPEDILAEASNDPSSQAGIMVDQLKTNMANMHTGDQNYTILPSDTQSANGNGARAFEIKFLGIEGGGKNFDVVALVSERRKAIYNAFGAGNLIAGDEGGGSYNLIEGKSSIHTHFLNRDISVIEEIWNTDIIRQLFRLNEWELSLEDMPKLVAGEIEPVSLDEVSKALQRVGSVGMTPIKDPVFLNEVYEKLGFNYRFNEDMTPDEVDALTGEVTSRAGDGMESGMPNSTSKNTSTDSSVGNKENT